MIQDKINHLQDVVYTYVEAKARDYPKLAELESKVNSLSTEILKMSDSLAPHERDQVAKQMSVIKDQFDVAKYLKEIAADTEPLRPEEIK